MPKFASEAFKKGLISDKENAKLADKFKKKKPAAPAVEPEAAEVVTKAKKPLPKFGKE